MDLLIHFLVFIFRALLDQNKPRQTPAPPATRGRVPPAAAPPSQTRSQPLVPRSAPTAQDPFADSGDRWRRLLTLLGFIALAAIAAVWFFFLRGG